MPADISGRAALVTGGARGIGLASAEELAALGAHVMIVDLEEAPEQVAALQAKYPGQRFGSVGVDVREEEQVQAALAQAHRLLGSLDILVTSAGTVGRRFLQDTSLEQWERDIDTNLKGTFLFLKNAIHPYMAEQKSGSIITISSISGLMGGPSTAGDSPRSGAPYAASKGGVIALTKWIAKEYGHLDIVCNSVAPGPIASAMTDSLDYDFSQQVLERFGRPEDIAEAVGYLAGATYVTGQVLRVCGGSAIGGA